MSVTERQTGYNPQLTQASDQMPLMFNSTCY